MHVMDCGLVIPWFKGKCGSSQSCHLSTVVYWPLNNADDIIIIDYDVINWGAKNSMNNGHDVINNGAINRSPINGPVQWCSCQTIVCSVLGSMVTPYFFCIKFLFHILAWTYPSLNQFLWVFFIIWAHKVQKQWFSQCFQCYSNRSMGIGLWCFQVSVVQ